MISAQNFWIWFEINNSKFFFLNQIDNEAERERLLAIFLDNLHQYCDQLFFEIGGHPDEIQDLIITAEGNIEYFDKVEELVSCAPKLKNWNIIAFKPPADSDFIIDRNNAKIDPRKTWFIPLENKNKPELFGLRLFVEDYLKSKESDFLNAAYLALDSLLGEKVSASRIQHVEITKLTGDPNEKNLRLLTNLPNYLKIKK